MKVECVYPVPPKRRIQRHQLICAARWPFLAAAIACPVVNLCLGGSAWSLVALWGLWMLWGDLVAPTMVEYNRVSQFTKVLAQCCGLLLLIDLILAPGRIRNLLPIVCFAGLTVAAVLFFTDFSRQKQNIIPLMLLCLVAFLSAGVCLLVPGVESQWGLIVLAALSFGLFVVCAVCLGGGFFRGLHKYFLVK